MEWQDVNKTLHMMYQVPWDYNLHENLWNATIMDGPQGPNEDLHKNLYWDKGGMPKPHKAGSWATLNMYGLALLGNMTTDSVTTLELELKKA